MASQPLPFVRLAGSKDNLSKTGNLLKILLNQFNDMFCFTALKSRLKVVSRLLLSLGTTVRLEEERQLTN